MSQHAVMGVCYLFLRIREYISLGSNQTLTYIRQLQKRGFQCNEIIIYSRNYCCTFTRYYHKSLLYFFITITILQQRARGTHRKQKIERIGGHPLKRWENLDFLFAKGLNISLPLPDDRSIRADMERTERQKERICRERVQSMF